MTKVADIAQDLSKLPSILDQYEQALNGFEDNIRIQGKLLEHANREQAAWQSFYDQRRIELYSLVKYMDAYVQRVRGRLFKNFTENYSRELSDRAKDKYIDNEQEYLTALELYLEVKELHDKYESVVESFKARGYALNNITKVRVSALEDTMI